MAEVAKMLGRTFHKNCYLDCRCCGHVTKSQEKNDWRAEVREHLLSEGRWR